MCTFRLSRVRTVIVAICLGVLVLSPVWSGGGREATPATTATLGDAPSETGSGVLRLTAGRPLETLNPHQQAATDTADFLNLVTGKLYRFAPGSGGEGYEILSELAADPPVRVNDEGTVWRITVRDDALWANGEPITAEDFLYSWQMVMDPGLLNHRANAFHGSQVQVVNALEYVVGDATWEEVGIDLIDESTFEFTLILPVSEFMLMNFFSGLPVSLVYPPLYEAGMNADRTSTNYGTDVNRMVSSGPFMVDSWRQGSEYTAVKNPNYVFADRIWLAGVNYRVIAESGTVMQLFERGEVDFVSLSDADFQRFREDPRVIEVPARSVQRIVINLLSTEHPILQDIRFRQALFFATDRATSAAVSSTIPANYIIPTTHVMNVDDGTLYRNTPEARAILNPSLGYDPALARELFDAAMVDAGLDTLTLQLAYHEGVEARRAMSEYLQQHWNEVFGGRLTITLQAVPSSQLAARLREYPNNDNAFELGWTGTGHDDFNPVSALAHYYSGTARRKGPYFSDGYDELYRTVLAMPIDDLQGRLELIAEAERVMLEDASFVPVTQGLEFGLASDRVEFMSDGWSIALRHGWKWARIVD